MYRSCENAKMIPTHFVIDLMTSLGKKELSQNSKNAKISYSDFVNDLPKSAAAFKQIFIELLNHH